MRKTTGVNNRIFARIVALLLTLLMAVSVPVVSFAAEGAEGDQSTAVEAAETDGASAADNEAGSNDSGEVGDTAGTSSGTDDSTAGAAGSADGTNVDPAAPAQEQEQPTDPAAVQDPAEQTDPAEEQQAEGEDPQEDVQPAEEEPELVTFDDSVYRTLKNRTVTPKKFSINLRTLLGESRSGYAVVQGGCTDGTYIYELMVSSSNQKGRVLKLKLSNNKVVKKSAVLNIHHGNGMTYDSKRHLLVVSSREERRQELTCIDPDTLKIVRQENVKYDYYKNAATGLTAEHQDNGLAAVAYVSKFDCYIAMERLSHDLIVFDPDTFQAIAYINTTITAKYPAVYQAMDADEKYVYLLLSPSSDGTQDSNVIVALDWNAENLLPLFNGVLEEVPAVETGAAAKPEASGESEAAAENSQEPAETADISQEPATTGENSQETAETAETGQEPAVTYVRTYPKFIADAWKCGNNNDGRPDAAIKIKISYEAENIYHTTDSSGKTHFYLSAYYNNPVYKYVKKKVPYEAKKKVTKKVKWKKVNGKWKYKKVTSWTTVTKYKTVKTKVVNYYKRDNFLYDLGVL